MTAIPRSSPKGPWPKATAVNPSLMTLLPGADFSDAYSVTVSDPSIDAMTATKRALASPPVWARPLMLLRDIVVTPLGLKTRFDASLRGTDRVGIFPVVSETPGRVVLGFDDRHLDFRVIVDVQPEGEGGRLLTATTLVRTNRTSGRLYLAAVTPFHRMIVPAALAQIGA